VAAAPASVGATVRSRRTPGARSEARAVLDLLRDLFRGDLETGAHGLGQLNHLAMDRQMLRSWATPAAFPFWPKPEQSKRRKDDVLRAFQKSFSAQPQQHLQAFSQSQKVISGELTDFACEPYASVG
jgi:hypothetical protein